MKDCNWEDKCFDGVFHVLIDELTARRVFAGEEQ
jgi:hypothetical protein